MSVADSLMDALKAYTEPVETYFGLYAGVVTSNDDDEKKGRVKVRLPWIDPDFETEWAPVSQIYAGSDYGAYWIPEQGDQVVVAFLRGELRKPIVVSSIYSRDRTPYMARGDGSKPKLFRTMAGHMLLMEDGEGPKIQLVDKTGKNEVVIDSGSNTVTVRADADVVVEAKKNVKVTASQSVEVEASQSVSISAKTDLSLKATGSISIEAQGALTLSGASIALN